MTTATLELTQSAPVRAQEPAEPLGATLLRDDALALCEWKRLDQRLQNSSLSCSFDWVDTWINHFGHLPHEYLVVRDGSRVAGIALLVRTDRRVGPFADRRVHFGTAGEPDGESVCVEYHRPLVAPEHEDAFFQLLFQHLDRDSRWDTLHLNGIDGALANSLLEARPGAIVRRVPSHFVDLNETRALGKDYKGRLGASTKQCVKTNLKLFPDVKIEWSQSLDQAEEILEDLIRLHQERWTSTGEPGSYSSPRFTAFHRELLRRWQPQGKVVLTRVRQGDLLLGCVHMFVEQNRLLFYSCGSARLDPKSSPGMFSEYLTIQQGLERGYDAFDFLGGDTMHKRRMSTHANELAWLAWRRPRWKFQALSALKSIKNWLRSQRTKATADSQSNAD